MKTILHKSGMGVHVDVIHIADIIYAANIPVKEHNTKDVIEAKKPEIKTLIQFSMFKEVKYI